MQSAVKLNHKFNNKLSFELTDHGSYLTIFLAIAFSWLSLFGGVGCKQTQQHHVPRCDNSIKGYFTSLFSIYLKKWN